MTDSHDTASRPPAQSGTTVAFSVSNGAPVIVPHVGRIYIDNYGPYRYVTAYRVGEGTVKFSGFGSLTLEAIRENQ